MLLYKSIRFSLVLSLILVITPSCGFKPLYSKSDHKKQISGTLKISDAGEKEEYYLREELIRTLGEPLEDAYLLKLKVKTTKANEVITPNNEITSYRLLMTAEYTIESQDGETILPTQLSSARTGFSSARNSTGYTTQIAEEDAKKRLAKKIGNEISIRLLILSEKWLK